MSKYCEDCGCKVYGGHCVNCHEETFIAQQYRENNDPVPASISEKETEQAYDLQDEGATMNKKYVTSLEISKRMKELGFKQESEFYWITINGKEWFLAKKSPKYTTCTVFENGGYWEAPWGEVKEYYSAYLTGELGEILPWFVEIEGYKHSIHSYRLENEFGCAIECLCFDDNDCENCIIKECRNNLFSKTEANARGLMACYLKEQGLLEVKDEA